MVKLLLTIAITMIITAAFTACGKSRDQELTQARQSEATAVQQQTQTAVTDSSDPYAKIMNGDLSDFTGVWANSLGERIQLRADGTFGDGQTAQRIVRGMYRHDSYAWGVEFEPDKDGMVRGYGVEMLTAGVDTAEYMGFESDSAKVRILIIGSGDYSPSQVYYLESAETQSRKAFDLPKVVYVNSADGLRGRAEPSTNSSTVRVFLYGQRIVATERSSVSVTIDGITDYWYKTYFGDGDLWLFGGYLSESYPPDAYVLFGMWHFRNRSLEYGPSCEGAEHYIFTPDGGYCKSSYMHYVQLGKWKVDGNGILIEYAEPIPDSMEWSSDEQMEHFQLITVNPDNIDLIYYNKNRLELVRCGDPSARNW